MSLALVRAGMGRWWLIGLASALVAAGTFANPGVSQTATTVVFHVYDGAGHRLSFRQFRAIQESGAGSNGDNDALLRPDTLVDVEETPLYASDRGTPVFDWPGRPVTLSLAWRTSSGYITLMLDVRHPGTYNFTCLAAEQSVGTLRRELRARRGFKPAKDLKSALATVARLWGQLEEARSDSRRGALGQQTLDAATRAQTLLLSEYGRARARRGVEWGVTFDHHAGVGAIRSVHKLFGHDGWVRLVFDRASRPSDYLAEINALHRAGLHVLGELLDSSDAQPIGFSAFKSRVDTFVGQLPEVDEWEVGNEVNLRGLNPAGAAEAAYAAAYAHQHTRARTLLTLYWSLGEDAPRFAMFNWVAAHRAAFANVDDVGLSVYPQEAPLGSSIDRALTTLHRALPRQRLLISELGYDIPDAPLAWWWGDRHHPGTLGRERVATFYQSAILGYPFSGGGTYWWYYLEDTYRSEGLIRALAAVHRAARQR